MRVVVFTASPIVVEMGRVLLRARGDEVVGVVTSTRRFWGRETHYPEVVKQCPSDADVVISNSPDRLAELVRPMKPDPILSCGFLWKVPAAVLAIPPLGAINAHDSLLPRHRGPLAVNWAVRCDDPETGMTIHRMDADFDTGPILAQGWVAIRDDDTVRSIVERITSIAAPLFDDALDRVLRGDSGMAQSRAGASAAPFFEDSWKMLDWTKPARQVHNQARSWDDDGALGSIRGDPRRILGTRLVVQPKPTRDPPGTVLGEDGRNLWIQCGDGPLLITEHVAEIAR